MALRRLQVLLALSACTLILPSQAQSGKGTLTGSVTDTQGSALQGVKITLHPGGYSALTNSTGQYAIIGVNAGQYTLGAMRDLRTRRSRLPSQTVRPRA